MKAQKRLAATRQRKRFRVRKKIVGTAERPRLSVFRSSKHIYAQMIDDLNGVTLAAAGTAKKAGGKGSTILAAMEVGKKLAETARAAGVSKAAFDRGRYMYHGRLKALADAVRAGGIQF
jgi:large subunit ribosomal protein L18